MGLDNTWIVWGSQKEKRAIWGRFMASSGDTSERSMAPCMMITLRKEWTRSEASSEI